MDNQQLLYHSKGVSPKFKKYMQGFLIVYFVLGIIFLLLPSVADAPSFCAIFGIFLIVLCLLTPKLYSSIFQSRLYIYEDHVEGIAVNCIESNPDSLFPALGELESMRDTKRLKFTMSFQEITDIQTPGSTKLFPQITITKGEKQYIVMAKEADKAYQLLCDKVFGQSDATCCVCCGHEISTTAENCPHCGQLTRYGKNQKDQQKDQMFAGKSQLTSAVGAVIFIIGLFILIPAIIDLNEISDYASLYASIYPSKAKKMVAKVILGWLVACGGLGITFSNWILSKLKSHRR